MTRSSITLTLLAAACAGGVGGIASSGRPQAAAQSASREGGAGGIPLSDCSVVDGDTLRCAGERVRLLGIDAPELPGHCNPGRDCAPGDPYAATASLGAALDGRLRIERVGIDRYGRTLALVAGGRGDLSCWQLGQGQAIYKPGWDDGGQLAARCPAAR